MPKLQNPPQGGEKYLCLTLFLTMMMAVVSAVAIIYSIVIIYVPAKTVLESNLQGPKKCTTITMDRDIDDPKPGGCENWTSCHEWCLSKSNKECSHVWASARELGTEINFDGCDLTEEHFVNHKCNTLEDLEELNCKLFSTEKDENGKFGDGDAEICVSFDNIQVQCVTGVCKNISEVYKCDFHDRLTDIQEDWEETVGKGFCHCQQCTNEDVSYPGECPELTSKCIKEMKNWKWHEDGYENKTEADICSAQPCATCKSICNSRNECFDMKARRDPTVIGTDEYGNPVVGYFTCTEGYCVEIYDLKCERRCDSREFDMRGKNSVIFSGEKIIIADCSAQSTATDSRLNSKIPGQNTLFVSCSNVTVDHEARSILTYDCVNGTWFPDDFNGGVTNYSYMHLEYSHVREDPQYRASEISYEQDITIFNATKLKINIEGCVNTLAEECTDFYDTYGRDGRNYTARAIYECWYDPAEPDFVVINFDPDKTLMLLIFFAAIPGGILTFSCTYMCGCSRFVFVGEDGHMRLHCCGKAVTGIGNVPVFDPPRRKKFRPIAEQS